MYDKSAKVKTKEDRKEWEREAKSVSTTIR